MSGAVRIAGKRRRVRIGIIDDVDRPEARMLALAIGMAGAAQVEYLSPHHQPLRGRNYGLLRWTDISAFGIALSLAPDGDLQVEQVRESSAVYPDGEPRRWQGWRSQEIQIRPALAEIVSRFVALNCPVREAAS